MRLGKYFKYLCLLSRGKQARRQHCLSRQLAGGLGKQPGRQWETPGDNARYQGLNLHMPLGNSKCAAWCRQGNSLNPPPRDGVPVCARLQAPVCGRGLPGTAPAPSPISSLGQVVFLVLSPATLLLSDLRKSPENQCCSGGQHSS